MEPSAESLILAFLLLLVRARSDLRRQLVDHLAEAHEPEIVAAVVRRAAA